MMSKVKLSEDVQIALVIAGAIVAIFALIFGAIVWTCLDNEQWKIACANAGNQIIDGGCYDEDTKPIFVE